MSGIGVIALAGIVVNNNIVLLDTYKQLRKRGENIKDCIIRTGAQRLRPVLLTTLTTFFGLIPMAIGLNIDFINTEAKFRQPYFTMVDAAIKRDGIRCYVFFHSNINNNPLFNLHR